MNELADKSVLIVDDDQGMLRALGKVLSHAGMQVSRSPGIRDAIEELWDHENPFDLVITDLRMPVASGFVMMDAVRGAFPDVPVILITAYGYPDMTPQCWEQLGAAAYLEKPISAERLLDTVCRVFTEKKQTTATIHKL